MVWIHSLSAPDEEPNAHNHQKSAIRRVLDGTNTIAVLYGDEVGFKKLKKARSAWLWWIICTIQLPASRRQWANKILGGGSS
jgi:hypothetical protein